MLHVKSFSISDDKGVNELLEKYRLAAGAHILVSEGKILVPYEDGLPPNKAQQIVEIREHQHKFRQEKELIEHSNRVLQHLIADAEDRVNVARAAVEKGTANQPRKAAQKNLEEAEAALNQLVAQVKLNEHEIARQQVNIDEYEGTITALSDGRG